MKGKLQKKVFKLNQKKKVKKIRKMFEGRFVELRNKMSVKVLLKVESEKPIG